ncbi:glycosyltransferase [Paenibacillus agilis]|uniref:Glycosyltransferase n=1 Tax=Paenibacillus agilis TaxID=3020863 RepID=A0A559IP65_9BACL|nr:glycosyltransferase [Paenibacillus agilis]TVX89439.1 glycosyltransferase [Paenibacillus agilis]
MVTIKYIADEHRVRYETPYGSKYPTYHDQKLKEIFQIKPGDRVLDVGGGSRPFAYASVVTDMFFEDNRHRGGNSLQILDNIEYVQCDILSLPFKDKEFDFVICRHVLEHVALPDVAAKELSRVAKRGFVEMPSRYNEHVHGYPEHLWLCDVKEDRLIFEPKSFIRNPHKNISRKLHYSDPEFRRKFEVENRYLFCTQLYWEDSFEIEVVEKQAGVDYFDIDNPYHTVTAYLDYALNYMSFQLSQVESEIAEMLKSAQNLLPNNIFLRNIINMYTNRSKMEKGRYVSTINELINIDLLKTLKDSDENDPSKLFIQQLSDPPLVSIVVRTKNREQLLLRCLESLNQQLYSNIEVVVVNDGGKDVGLVVESLTVPYRYISYEQSVGRAAALNIGLKHANGEYINFVDDDDIVYAEHISTLMKTIVEKEVSVAYSDAMLRLEHKINDDWITYENRLDYSRDFDAELLIKTNYLPILTVLFKKELVDQSGLINESYSVLEDWDFWIRLSRVTEFEHIKQVTAEYSQRIDKDNATQNEQSAFASIRKDIERRYMSDLVL